MTRHQPDARMDIVPEPYRSQESAMTVLTRHALFLISLTLMVWGSSVSPAHAQTELIEYYATDSVGSIRVVFDPSGTVKARSDYLPFGEEWQASGNLPTQRFTGQQRDTDEDLDYFGARSYQPRTGRFATVDPVFAGLFQPQAWNRYAYALNSPLVYTDPTGLQAQACAGPTKVMTPDGTVLSSSGGVGNCKDIPADGGSVATAMWLLMRELFWGVANAPGLEGEDIPKGGRADLFKPDVTIPYTGDPDGGATPTGDAIAEVLQLAGSLGGGGPLLTTVAKQTGKEVLKESIKRNVFNRSGRAPETKMGPVSQDGFLKAAERFLGPGYKEVSPGRYLSADGLRQVRFGSHETRGPNLHGHFEAYDRAGGQVIDNVSVSIKPRP